jgi:acyl-CoA hydrolase
MRPGKRVSDTASEDQTYKVFPNDLNSHNTVFGGAVMAVLDRTAAVVAERHSERLCVTAAVDSMHFLAAAGRGDVLIIKAAVNRAWRTSMEIGVRVVAENYRTKERKHILSAYFTFVAVDDDHKPTEVPAVIPETQEQQRRYDQADARRERRHREAEERRQSRT